MDAQLRSIPEEEYTPTCGLCHGPLRIPKVLPCLDIFCLECLEQRYDGWHGNEADNQPECPTCGEAFVIPYGGLQELTLASHMETVPDLLSTDMYGVCQFCDDDQKRVESFCLDCSLSMCTTCRKLHARVRGTSGHNLVSLNKSIEADASDVTSAVRTVLQKRHTECTRHEGQPLMYSCATCKELLCISCKMGHHEDHEVELLDGAARSRRESLVDIVSLLQERKKCTKASLQEATRYLVMLHDEFARAERHVETHAQRLINEIAKEKDKVLCQLSTRRQQEIDDVKQHMRSLEGADRQVTKASHYTQGVLSRASDAEVVQVSRIITDRYRVIRQYEDYLLNKRLRVNIDETPPTDEALLPKLQFGVRVEEVYPDLLPASIVRTLQVEDSVTGMAVTSDDLLLVVSFCGKKLCIYKRTGKLIQTVQDGMTQPISAVVTSPERIYVTDLSDSKTGMCIWCFTTKGDKLQDHVPLPCKPWGVSVTKEGDFVVCHPGNRKVGIYKPDGTLKLSLKSESGKNLFTNPRCVAVNIDGNIIVSDFARHNIRLFDPDGKYLSSYGSEGKGHEQLCHPCGVCCDRYGHILVADSNNNRIHVLNAQGELRGYLFDGERGGVVEPVALAVSSRGGELMVGQWDGRVHVVRYL